MKHFSEFFQKQSLKESLEILKNLPNLEDSIDNFKEKCIIIKDTDSSFFVYNESEIFKIIESNNKISIIPIDKSLFFAEMIRKLPNGKWRLYSRKKGQNGERRNLGTFDTKEDAINREKQVQYFKHLKEYFDEVPFLPAVLMEYSREQIQSQFTKFFGEKETEIKEHFGSVENLFNHLENIDPKGGSEYVRIFLTFYKKGIFTVEDLKQKDFLKDFLIKYDILKKTNFKSEIGDINRIWKKEEFDTLIKQTNEIYQKYLEKKSQKEDRGKGVLLYTAKNGTKFYESFDIKHACYIGQGSTWCTAATQSDNMFHTIVGNGYRLITMVPENREDPREKYQINMIKKEAFYIKEFYFGVAHYNFVWNYLNKPISWHKLRQPVREDYIEFLFDYIFPDYTDRLLESNPKFKFFEENFLTMIPDAAEAFDRYIRKYNIQDTTTLKMLVSKIKLPTSYKHIVIPFSLYITVKMMKKHLNYLFHDKFKPPKLPSVHNKKTREEVGIPPTKRGDLPHPFTRFPGDRPKNKSPRSR